MVAAALPASAIFSVDVAISTNPFTTALIAIAANAPIKVLAAPASNFIPPAANLLATVVLLIEAMKPSIEASESPSCLI